MKKPVSIKLALLFSFCFGVFNSFAQIPTVQWDKSFGGNHLDVPYNIILTNDGGYLLSGFSFSSNNGDRSSFLNGFDDLWIVKIDAFGNKQWEKSFGGPAAERAYAAIQLPDGSYILGGYSGSGITIDKSAPSRGMEDFWLLKLDQNGNKLWDKAYGGDWSEFLKTIKPTSDGGFVLGGWSESGISGEKSEAKKGRSDYWVVKIDSLGNKQWDRSLGGNGIEWFTDLIQSTDGGYLIGGFSAVNSGNSGDRTQPSRGKSDIWVIKINAAGIKEWDKTFGGNENDHLNSLIQTPDGGYLLGGGSNSDISGDKSTPHLGGSDYWLIKIDGLGNKLWDKIYGGTGEDGITKIIKTTDGNYMLTGVSTSGISNTKLDGNIGGEDFWLLKIDGNGDILWDKTIGGTLDDINTSIMETAPDNYILAGHSLSGYSGDKTSFNRGNWDFWVLKLGNPYYSRAITGFSDYTNATQLSIHPNPTTSNFTLRLSTNQPVTATLTSSLGQQIESRNLSPQNGSITEQFSMKNLAKGIYTLAVTSSQTRVVKKIVVQ